MTNEKLRLIENFKSPTVEYRGKPFWSWNGELSSDELIRQAKIMKDMGLGGFFMHSRSGLITEYLGDEWFECICAVADEAEKLGLEAWLYDEDRWPSGSAGGMVTRDRKYSMKSLYLHEYDTDIRPEIEGERVALFVGEVDGINLLSYVRVDGDDIANVNSAAEYIKSISSGEGQIKVLHFSIIYDKSNSNYNGETYIDTMSYAATNRFIELTHEKYKERCGDRIGKSIKGIFTDEPQRGHCLDGMTDTDGIRACPICYTDDIFSEFEARYGYAPLPILPELFYRYKNEAVAPIKLHYLDLSCNLFIERFAMPLNKWCEDNGIIFTGHVLHEDSLMNQTSPNGSLMRFYEHMGAPGIDCLSQNNTAYWIAKQLSSVARQLDKKWTLSELYGATGWEFDFKGHKYVGDWQTLFGINLRCHHLSWYTMEGESKRDYPASILHQSPYWSEYSTVEDYFARFGLLSSQGDAACDVLLLNPIESLWCQAYIGWADWIFNKSPDVAPFEERYAQLFYMLVQNHIDFDYGEEDIMRRHASVSVIDGTPYLCVGKMKYKAVLVSNMLTIRKSTVELIEKFISLGGKVIFAGDTPKYIDAVRSDIPEKLSHVAIKTAFDEGEIVSAIKSASDEYISISYPNGDIARNVFTQMRRNVCGSELVFALNMDKNTPANGLTLKIKRKNPACINMWNMERGDRYSINSYYSDGEYVYISLSLFAAECVCIELSDENENLPLLQNYSSICSDKIDTKDFEYELDEDNVCVLDYAAYQIDSGEWHSPDEVLRVDSKIRDAFSLEHRGGEMLQPWFAKSIENPKYAKVNLEYSFYVEKIPSSPIYLAAERPEIMSYYLNGTALKYKESDGFWIDKCFKKIQIPQSALKIGENVISVSFDFLRTTNIESVYLVGKFGVSLKDNKKAITSLPNRIGLGSLINYHLPFYTGKVSYKIPHSAMPKVKLSDNQRLIISVGKFHGAYAEVEFDGEKQVLAWDPYECDVTEAYLRGCDIYVSVMGTRRNTFGPLHLNPPRHLAYGPDHFRTAGDGWSDSYLLVDSGIEEIKLIVKEIK